MADPCNPSNQDGWNVLDIFGHTSHFQQNLGWFLLAFTISGFFHVSVSSYIVTLEGPCIWACSLYPPRYAVCRVWYACTCCMHCQYSEDSGTLVMQVATIVTCRVTPHGLTGSSQQPHSEAPEPRKMWPMRNQSEWGPKRKARESMAMLDDFHQML